MAIDKEKILNIAQKYVLKGQSQKAITELQKLIEASPKDKRLYLKLGDLHLKNNEKDRALEQYIKVAQLYVEEDLNFRAISMYKKVLSIDPKHLEALRKVADLYQREGLRGDAKLYYQTILKIQPRDQEALRGLKSFEEQQPSKDVPKHIPTQPAIVSPSLPEKKEMKEIPVVMPAEPVRPAPQKSASPAGVSAAVETEAPDKDSEMHYHLGIAYKEMELFDYAISEFEMAASNPSIRFDCYIMLGNCYMEKGDYTRSIDYFKQGTQIKGLPDEKLAHLHYSLGLAYEASGMMTEALTTYHQVLKLDRSFAEAQEKIKRLQQK